MVDRNPFDAVYENIEITHRVLKRGVKQMETFAPKISQADLPSFLGYSLAFLGNLGSHHDQEEAILFPRLSPKVPAIADRHKEHEILHGYMDTFKAWLEGVRDGKETWDVAKFEALLKPVKETVIPHVTAEEQNIFPETLKGTGFTQEEAKELVEAMAKAGREAPDRSTVFAFLLVHTTAEERARFFARAPYFVREWIFWSYTLWNNAYWTYASSAAL